jgi:dipeptidyl aminopeptidase/acylaminoacyl peptidase
MTTSRIHRWAATLAAVLVLPSGALAQAPVPVESFFASPSMRSVVPSPSGRWLATVVAPKDARAHLVVSDLQDKEPARVVAQFARLDVINPQWVNDEWLVFRTDDVVNRGRYWESAGSGLIAVNRSGERLRGLIRRHIDTLFPSGGAQPLEGNHSLLGMGAEGTNEVIVGEHLFGSGPGFTGSHVLPKTLNVSTGERRTLVNNPPPDVFNWMFDVKGRPRAARASKDDKWTLYFQDLNSQEWKTIGRFDRLQAGLVPMFVDEADQLYVSHLDSQGFRAVSRYDIPAAKPDPQSLVSTPGYSSTIGIKQDHRSGALQSVTLLTDARSQVWLTADMKVIQAKVDAMLPGRVNLLQCGRCQAPDAVVVLSYSDRVPGEYLLYRPKVDKWERLGNYRPEIDPTRMARKELHRFKARDGLEIPVWVTRPAGADAKALPAVMLVHGGPWARGGEWEWDGEAQFLASRGYVVVEPEFRGSTGWGSAHYEAGWKQWGQAMQDDVTDAMKFVVQRGWVDGKRVCIAGASYGGYATLMGLAKDPDQYRCGVAWVGVSDPMLMFTVHWSDISRESKEHTMPQLIGDPQKDAAMLKANSPLEQAARIKAPVLLAYGGRDRRVPIEHGERMREALRKAGNEPEWVVYDDEEHGFFRPENKIDFWKRVEAFLTRHLK